MKKKNTEELWNFMGAIFCALTCIIYEITLCVKIHQECTYMEEGTKKILEYKAILNDFRVYELLTFINSQNLYAVMVVCLSV